MKLIKYASIALVTAISSGCSVLTIGEDEFACSGKPDGSLCKGPMEVYELTNNHDNLDHLMVPREVMEARIEHNKSHNHPYNFVHADGSVEDHDIDEDESYDVATHKALTSNMEVGEYNPRIAQELDIYETRSFNRQMPHNYETPQNAQNGTMMMQQPQGELNELRQTGVYGNTMAPEALAALTQPKVLRILVFPWKDENKNLHLPGYIYKKLEDETWIVGNQANRVPTRVIPAYMNNEGQRQLQQRQTQQNGVDGLNVQRLGGITKQGR
jgi:conjugal transfer pilus assembly protein TraV